MENYNIGYAVKTVQLLLWILWSGNINGTYEHFELRSTFNHDYFLITTKPDIYIYI